MSKLLSLKVDYSSEGSNDFDSCRKAQFLQPCQLSKSKLSLFSLHDRHGQNQLVKISLRHILFLWKTLELILFSIAHVVSGNCGKKVAKTVSSFSNRKKVREKSRECHNHKP